MKKLIIFAFAVVMFANPFPRRSETENNLSRSDMLWFRAGKYSSLDDVPNAIDEELSFDGFTRDYGYYIVKFTGNSQEGWKDKILQSQDADVFYYVPTNAWVFRLRNAEAVKAFPFVEAVLPLVPSLRVLPELLTEKQAGDSLTGNVRLKITVFQGDDYLILAELLAKMGAELIDATQGFHHEFVVIDIAPERTREFAIAAARYEGTEWVERDYPDIPLNDWSRWIVQSYNRTDMESGDQLYTQMSVDYEHVPIHRRNLYGQNQIVGYLDSGLDYLSIYFCDNGITDPPMTTGWTAPSDNGHRKVRAYNRGTSTSGDFDDTDVSLGGHGTHVGGSIAGDNQAHDPLSGTYDQGDGMAPKARLVFTDGANGSYGIYTPTDMNTLFDFAQDCGAYIHSNSYGSSSPNYYNTDAQQLDEFMWNNPNFLIFFAAGNDNSSPGVARVATYNTAKSMVSVGATESGFGSGSTSYSNPGTSTNSDPENMAEFSSHGPTDEGLLKPNVSVPGGWYIWSADNVDGGSLCHTGMESMGGTSMACPTCAGMTALIRQYFVEGFYPSGAANSSDGFSPSGALMKAMLINGTRNMSGSYTIDATDNSGHQDAPSNGQGWGRVVMDDCMYFDDTWGTDIRKLYIVDETTGFSSSGQVHNYFLNTGSSTEEPLKVVLSYSDYPGSPAVGTPGVNDLNLEVTIAGNTYLGNNFASSGARSVTGGSIDQINRDEVVWLNPIPGEALIITVNATSINTSPQPYALVVTGDVTSGSPNSRPEIPDISFLFDNARTPEIRPQLQFFVPVDDDGDSLHFQIQIDDDDDFASPLATYSTETDGGFSGVSFPTPEGTGAGVNFVFGSDLTDGATYFWRVRADDGVIAGNWSYSRSFTVDTGLDEIDWFQTIDPQFERGTPVDVDITSDMVHVAGETVFLEDDFESYSSQADFEAEWSTNGSFYSWQSSQYHSPTHAIRLLDETPSTRSSYYHDFTAIASGYAECWSKTEDVDDEGFIIALYEGGSRVLQVYYREGYIAYWDGAARHNLEPIDPGNWHYFRADFDCGSNSVTITIDTNSYGPYTFSGTPSSVSIFAQGTLTYNSYRCDSYFDDVKVAQGDGSGEGVLTSPDILLSSVPEAVGWDRAFWTQESGDSIVLVVDKKVSGSYIPYDSAYTGTARGEVDLSSMGSTDTIRLRAKLIVSGSVEPNLLDWGVSYQRNTVAIDLMTANDGGTAYDEWILGMMPPYDARIMDATNRVYVKNSGGVPVDLSLNATGIDWSLSNWPGTDTAVVMGLFSGTTPPLLEEFDTSMDYLTESFMSAGVSDAGPFASPLADGVNILPGNGEYLYMLFATPSVNNFPGEQRATITIQATPH